MDSGECGQRGERKNIAFTNQKIAENDMLNTKYSSEKSEEINE